MLIGAAAGALAQIFTLPVSTIATRQQVGDSVDDDGLPKRKRARFVPNEDAEKGLNGEAKGEQVKRDNSFWGVAKEINDEEGWAGYWLGLGPSMVLTVNPAITYGVFERVKSTVLIAAEKSGNEAVAKNGKITPQWTFYIGALSKILATVVRHFRMFAPLSHTDCRPDNIPADHDEDQDPDSFRRL